MRLDCKIQPTPDQAAALNRRRVLGLGAAGAAGVALTTLGAAAPASAHRGDRGPRRIPVENISIQLYTLSTLLAEDLDGTLAALARIGYRTVEHAGIPQGLTARQFRDKLRRHGLRATSGHNAPSPTDPFDLAPLRQALSDAAVLGQKTINISGVGLAGYDPATGPVPIATADGWKRYCELLNRTGRIAHDNGMRFGLHTHFWEFLPSGIWPR